jgi:hypothetical protein
LKPKAKSRSWAALQKDALSAKRRFDALLEKLSDAQLTRRLRNAELASLGDIVAHLAVANQAITQMLTAIGAGKTVKPSGDTSFLFKGVAGRSMEEVRASYEAAWQALQAVCQTEGLESSVTTAPHFLFGELNAKEWLALVAFHYDYHIRQVKSLRAKA